MRLTAAGLKINQNAARHVDCDGKLTYAWTCASPKQFGRRRRQNTNHAPTCLHRANVPVVLTVFGRFRENDGFAPDKQPLAILEARFNKIQQHCVLVKSAGKR